MANPEAESCPWIPVEGWRQVTELASREKLEVLILCPGRERGSRQLVRRAEQVFQLSEQLFSALSDVQTSQGVLGFFRKPSWSWLEVTSYILYMDRLRDPGNLGTLMRTAAATGLFSVVTGPNTVSCFKSKVVRASAGYLFSVPFLQGVCLTEVIERGYELWLAQNEGGSSLFKAKLKAPLALVLGSESSGIDPSLLRAPAHALTIPMSSDVDSLNAAVAGSLLMYEVVRRVSKNE